MSSRNIETKEKTRVELKKVEAKHWRGLVLHLEMERGEVEGDWIQRVADIQHNSRLTIKEPYGRWITRLTTARFDEETDEHTHDEFVEMDAFIERLSVARTKEDGSTDITMVLSCSPHDDAIAWLCRRASCGSVRLRMIEAQTGIEDSDEVDILPEDDRGRVHTREVAGYGGAESEDIAGGYVKVRAQAADMLFEMAGA